MHVSKPRARLCLNMIVKNEVANLPRFLKSVTPHISYWTILDTGSTDGTQELIKEHFRKAKIPGRLQQGTFESFKQARNDALRMAYEAEDDVLALYDYILLGDADMELVVQAPEILEGLTEQAYVLMQRASGQTYWNTRLVHKSAKAYYLHRTHEYLNIAGHPIPQSDKIYYLDHYSGSNRGNKQKRDIVLLLMDLAEMPDDTRTHYYLGQSFKEDGQHELAIKFYKRVTELNGWDEEIWAAQYNIAQCYAALQDWPKYLEALMKAFNMRPTRAETLWELARYYRMNNQNNAALMYASFGMNMPVPGDILPINRYPYEIGFKEEFSVVAYYSKIPEVRERGFRLCNELALNLHAPVEPRNVARRNLYWYCKPLSAWVSPEHYNARPIQIDLSFEEGYHAAAPSIVPATEEEGGGYWVMHRTVNYTIDGGKFPTPENIVRTRNFLLRLDANYNTISQREVLHPEDLPTHWHITGAEDSKLFRYEGNLHMVSMVVCPEGFCEQVHMELDKETAQVVKWKILRRPDPQRNEKNWMPLVEFEDPSGLEKLSYVYTADPTVLTNDEGEFSGVKVSLAADMLRGGPALLPFDDGFLTVTHEVVDWPCGQGTKPWRFYSHRFAFFKRWEKEGWFVLMKMSMPFYFQVKEVEYVAGLCWKDGDPSTGTLLLTHHLDDDGSWLVEVAASDVREMLK